MRNIRQRPNVGSSLRWVLDGLVEALGTEHQERVGHDYRTYDSSRRHCNVCFYLGIVANETSSLPGDEDIICIRKVKNREKVA